MDVDLLRSFGLYWFGAGDYYLSASFDLTDLLNEYFGRFLLLISINLYWFGPGVTLLGS